jgi:hypothetical protein
VIICKPGDPEAKGLVERFHDYLERSFLPGRRFSCPADFNGELTEFLSLAERARAESWTHQEYLAACLQREVAARDAHGGEGRIRGSFTMVSGTPSVSRGPSSDDAGRRHRGRHRCEGKPSSLPHVSPAPGVCRGPMLQAGPTGVGV